MLRILICDDEGIVRESLQFMIQKGFGEECELEFAKNGRTAIELAESFHPDIVLMDIQMPGINGLDAMQEIRENDKNIIFIVLTAYEKFEYTQRAITIGVMDYLTKPVRMEVLIETLKNAAEKVKDRREKKRSELEIKEKLEVIVPMIESGFIYSLMMNGEDSENMQLYKNLLGISSAYGYVLAIACGDELRKGTLSNTVGAGIRLQRHAMMFREMIKEETDGIPGAIMENKVVVVIPCEETEERERESMRVQKLTRDLNGQFDIRFKAGIGRVVPWEELSVSCCEAMEALTKGDGIVNRIECVEMQMEADMPEEELSQDGVDPVIRKAKKYIDENFKKNMSLEGLAEKLGISPYYFSRVFKETEGVNYIDYVTGLRIEYAKEQLKIKEKSIKEVCLDSGYSDPNYFSRMFKKWTGVTPTEFRKRL